MASLSEGGGGGPPWVTHEQKIFLWLNLQRIVYELSRTDKKRADRVTPSRG